MSDAPTPNPVSGQRARAQFTAALLLERHVNFSVGELRAALQRIAPQAVLADWGGPVVDPAVGSGGEMLTLDGEKLSVLVVDAPAPAAVLQPGPFANPFWPNAETEAARHKAHIVVIGLENPASREAALAKARTVTLLAAAIARLVPAIGVTWADAANLVRATAFAEMTKNIDQPGANVTPFWARLMLARSAPGQRDEPTMTAGTLGLRIFGLRELEYAPAALDPRFIMQHAYSTVEYLLSSGKRLADGETIGVEGQARFIISHGDFGDFASFPIARLSLSAGK
jgi:hypothetical protein